MMSTSHGNSPYSSKDEPEEQRAHESGNNVMSRLSSYDFCINYFHQFKENGESPSSTKNLEMSLLHLGFYLASWGMYRGSSFLPKQSMLGLKGAIEAVSAIATSNSEIWDLDVQNYSEPRSCQIILDTKKRLNEAFGKEKPSETLVTKIMLGVFGIVPAFDTYFKKATGLRVLNEKSLMQILKIYEEKKTLIDERRRPTKDIYGRITSLCYSRAKVIDQMYFEIGFEEQMGLKNKSVDPFDFQHHGDGSTPT